MTQTGYHTDLMDDAYDEKTGHLTHRAQRKIAGQTYEAWWYSHITDEQVEELAKQLIDGTAPAIKLRNDFIRTSKSIEHVGLSHMTTAMSSSGQQNPGLQVAVTNNQPEQRAPEPNSKKKGL